MTLSEVNNAASTKSGSDRTGSDRIGSDRIGSDRIVHFGLRVLRDLAFGFQFSSKIQTGFLSPHYFSFFLLFESIKLICTHIAFLY